MNIIFSLITVVFLFLCTFGATMYNTWLFTDMWKWFIMPLGAPALSFWATYGLLITVSWPFYGIALNNELYHQTEDATVFDAFKSGLTKLIYLMIMYTFLWLIGAVIH